jgi:hypothetical protein
MSHFVNIQLQIREAPILIRSLHELGFEHVEDHAEPVHLYGYQRDERPETAEVVIRRNYIGRASNDIGFRRQQSGEFKAIISEFDRHRFSDPWLQELNRRYAYNLIKEQAREQYLIVEEEQELANGDVVILLSERG